MFCIIIFSHINNTR